MPTASPASPKPPASRRRLWILLGVLVAMIGITMLGRYQSRVTPEMIEAANAGWLTSYEEAVAQSQLTGRPILVDFTADWCMPCQHMKFEIFPDPRVQAAMKEHYIPLRADVSSPQSPGPGPMLGMRYRVEATPTLLVIDAHGQELARHVGTMKASATQAWLEQHASPADVQTSHGQTEKPGQAGTNLPGNIL